MKKTDTCGVMCLHGLPGLLGGGAVLVVQGINMDVQIKGIIIMAVIALVAGFATGKIIAIFGRREQAYLDQEEFVGIE